MHLKLLFPFVFLLRNSAGENPYRFDRFQSQVRSNFQFSHLFSVIILGYITLVHRCTTWDEINQGFVFPFWIGLKFEVVENVWIRVIF